jgi:fatty-acyl-CoA synthase
MTTNGTRIKPHASDKGGATTDPLGDLTKRLTRLPLEAQALFTILRSGLLGPEMPHRLVSMALALEHYGFYGGAVRIAAMRDGDRPGVADDRGVLTFNELDQRSNALANALRARGVNAGSGVGILCRNHRGMLDATFATAKAGGRALFLNTDFAGPQAVEVCAREGVEILIYDEEFTEAVAGVDAPKGRFVAWTDDPVGATTENTIEALIAAGNPTPPPAPLTQGKVVILTSGTTGTPKGADRDIGLSLVAPGALLSKVPFHRGEATFIAPPMFHALGLANALLATAMGSTIVIRRRFDPEQALIATAEQCCSALVVVPSILHRLLSLGEERIAQLDLSALRIILCSGAQLEGAVATWALDVFGEVLYNLYGSTEVAWATIAEPTDLRAAPGTAGKAPMGTTVKLFDDEGQQVPAGGIGRIFVSNGEEFSGYTGGGSKEVIDGLMSTGDVGHFDDDGRLFVDGRDDEMIVSGGENVFPREIEELLAAHDAIEEAAAIGVADETFGERLRAYVVLRPGEHLDAEAVKDYVKANLARYKVPRDVVFLDQLPRNPTGKVLKRVLAEGEEDQ